MTKNSHLNLVLNYLSEQYSGLRIIDAWGEISLFYNPNDLLKRGIYFCTLKNKDGEHDKASYLNRADVFRMNFGVSKKTFVNIFKVVPKRPVKGGVIDGNYDFQSLDILTPHPVYGWMSWVSILNPSNQSIEDMKYLVNESYQLVIEKYKRKLKGKACSD